MARQNTKAIHTKLTKYGDKLMRDLFIHQQGDDYIVEAESYTAIRFLDSLCGYKWRMLYHTSEEDILFTPDKGTIDQLIKALSQHSFKFDNFLEGAN